MEKNLINQSLNMTNKELASKYVEELTRGNLLSLNLALVQSENEKLEAKVKELEELLDKRTRPEEVNDEQ